VRKSRLHVNIQHIYTSFSKGIFYSSCILFLFFFSISSLSASNETFTVRVVDGDTEEPLIGVTIYTKDGPFSTFTDLDGRAKLEGIGHREKVYFTYVGYVDLELPYYEVRQQKVIRLFTSNTLDSIVVVGRRDEPQEEIPFQIDRITKKQIAFRNVQTAADALTLSGNVFVQKSQMGGGSPVIRGFEANKVLLVVDGVRMNNAIYRNGHLQNSITLDPSILEQAEVIYGPGSLVYGSDALGGVVHYRTRDPKTLFDGSDEYYKFKSNVYTRFSSANQERTAHLDLDYASDHWGTLTSITYSSFDDLRAGDRRSEEYPTFGIRPFYIERFEVDQTFENPDPNIQVGTGYNQLDFLQKIKYQPNDGQYHVLNFQYSTSSDVPRYDNLTDTVGSADELKWAEWYYGPQKRLMASLKSRFLNPKALYDKATIIWAYQRIDEDRLRRRARRTQKTYNLEDVHVFSGTMDFEKNLSKNGRHRLIYGGDASHNIVESTAGQVNINTGAIINNELTRYPSGGSTMSAAAGFLSYKWKSRDSTLNWEAGLRYNWVQLTASYLEDDSIEWPAEYYNGIEVNNTALTWGTGLTWNTKNRWQLRLLAASAFRSPNIDDFAKIRSRRGFVTTPNIDLTPEHAITGEVTIGKTFGSIQNSRGMELGVSTTAFYTHLTDAIVRQLGTLPSGDSILIVGGEAEIVQQNKNASESYVYGLSGNATLKIGDSWNVYGGINYTYGRNIFVDQDLPMGHIPPTYGQAGISFTKGKIRLEVLSRFNAEKPITEYENYDPVTQSGFEGSSDNADRATPTGTPAWTTYNLYSSYRFSKSLSLDLAYENIFDVHYRPFSSGVSAAGRNFIVTLRGSF